MANEALLSFQSLLESIPGWITDLENLLDTATHKQTVLEAEAPSSSSPPADLVPKPQKSTSVCSRDTRGTRPQVEQYHSRRLVPLYYDGNAQKGFESLVRAVGTSRNSIRKGKLGMKLDNLGRSGSSSGSCKSITGEETIKGLGTYTFRTTTTTRRSSSDDTQAFDQVDSLLEKAQALCEQAAHQMLRDGDCSDEITKSKENFNLAAEIVSSQLPILSHKAEKTLMWNEEEERRSSQSSGSNDGFSLPSDGLLEVDLDEPEDDSDSEDFNIMSMKLPAHLSKYTAAYGRSQSPMVEIVQ